MGELSRLGVAPRYLRLGAGILAFTLANWLALALQDEANAWATLVMLGLLALGLWLMLAAVALPGERWDSTPSGSSSAAVVRAAEGIDAHGARHRLFALVGRSTGDRGGPASAERAVRRWIAAAIWTLLALSAVMTLLLATSLLATSSSSPRTYNSDAAAFNHYNADLALRGENPYVADAHFWDALRRFPSVGATPLHAGRYAHSTFGPSLAQVVSDVQDEITHPAQRGPEFAAESMHSYPALAFLVYVPGIWAGLPTTMFTSLVLLVAFLLAAAWGAPRALWLPLGVLLLADPFLVTLTLRGSFDVLALLPAMLAWRLLDRRALSPLLLGLACAVKQLVWPLVPFYLAIVWRREGARAALARIPVAAAGFLAPNLPFLLASPRAWASSMLLPVTLPIFPSGTGLVALARAGLMPLFPPPVFAVLELATLICLVAWFARAQRMPRPEVALIVALVPYLLAWHSLLAYFVALPALAVFACLRAHAAPAASSELGAVAGSLAAAR